MNLHLIPLVLYKWLLGDFMPSQFAQTLNALTFICSFSDGAHHCLFTPTAGTGT